MTWGDHELVDLTHVGEGSGGPEAAAGRAGEHVQAAALHVPAAERVAATFTAPSPLAHTITAWPASFSATLVRPPG